MSKRSDEEIIAEINTHVAKREALREAVLNLIEQARNRNIYDKAVSIAAALGKRERIDEHEYRIYKNTKDRLYIKHVYIGVNEVIVQYRSSPVFVYQRQKITAYRPDIANWEKLLNDAYAEAEKAEEKSRKLREQKQIIQVELNWGLNVDEADTIPAEALPLWGVEEPAEPKKPPQKLGKMPPKYSYAHR